MERERREAMKLLVRDILNRAHWRADARLGRLSQDRFAELVGVPASNMSKYKAGKVMPGAAVLVAALELAGVDLMEILGRELPSDWLRHLELGDLRDE